MLDGSQRFEVHDAAASLGEIEKLLWVLET
jgi:hypothetical protein